MKAASPLWAYAGDLAHTGWNLLSTCFIFLLIVYFPFYLFHVILFHAYMLFYMQFCMHIWSKMIWITTKYCGLQIISQATNIHFLLPSTPMHKNFLWIYLIFCKTPFGVGSVDNIYLGITCRKNLVRTNLPYRFKALKAHNMTLSSQFDAILS